MITAKGTKQKILDSAFELFSENGYSGTNIQSIADSVGIVKSALYRHFKSKEDIWNELCNDMSKYYSEKFDLMSNLPNITKDIDELYDMTMKLIDFAIYDRKIITMRKIIKVEQFRNKEVCNFASKFFLFDVQNTFTKIFDEMMKNGKIVKSDPEIIAFSYTAPIMSMVHFCDREPEKCEEVIAMLQKFISNFLTIHSIK